MRQFHNTSRRRGTGVTALSYWADNAAGYSWWTTGSDQMAYGATPEAIYLKLKSGYDRAGVHIHSWEPDDNFVVDYAPRATWIARDWKSWNTTL